MHFCTSALDCISSDIDRPKDVQGCPAAPDLQLRFCAFALVFAVPIVCVCVDVCVRQSVCQDFAASASSSACGGPWPQVQCGAACNELIGPLPCLARGSTWSWAHPHPVPPPPLPAHLLHPLDRWRVFFSTTPLLLKPKLSLQSPLPLQGIRVHNPHDMRVAHAVPAVATPLLMSSSLPLARRRAACRCCMAAP